MVGRLVRSALSVGLLAGVLVVLPVVGPVPEAGAAPRWLVGRVHHQVRTGLVTSGRFVLRGGGGLAGRPGHHLWDVGWGVFAVGEGDQRSDGSVLVAFSRVTGLRRQSRVR